MTNTTTARSMSDHAIEQAEALLADIGIPLDNNAAFDWALARVMNPTS